MRQSTVQVDIGSGPRLDRKAELNQPAVPGCGTSPTEHNVGARAPAGGPVALAGLRDNVASMTGSGTVAHSATGKGATHAPGDEDEDGFSGFFSLAGDAPLSSAAFARRAAFCCQKPKHTETGTG